MTDSTTTDPPKPASIRPVYVLHLRPEAGVDGTTAIKAALKLLGRRHGLRCVSIREAEWEATR